MKKYHSCLLFAVVCFLFLSSGGSAVLAESISVQIPVPDYAIRDNVGDQAVMLPDYGFLKEPGKPRLPARIFSIAIPPDARFESLIVHTGGSEELPGYAIRPATIPRTIDGKDTAISSNDRALYNQNYQEVYGSNSPYPAQTGEFIRTAGFRKYNLVDVRITPFQYRPATSTLMYHRDISVEIRFTRDESRDSGIIDNQPRMEKRARDIILNYDEAQVWHPGATGNRGLYEFVIITTSALESAVSELANWEVIKGHTVQVVTVEWIAANYTGYDLAEKMRNFLREKYPSSEWGIEDVCLVGQMSDVPMRHIYDDPDTDFYFAELSLPDSESWDANGNHQYLGSGDSCDYYAEVNVGRIPWSDFSTVQHICDKSIAYEMNDNPSFKQNVLLIGTFFWPDTDNAVLMEAKVDQPGMEDWTMTRMYEDAQSSYPCDYDVTFSNVQNVWSGGTFSFVNWAGHGSATACYEYYPSQPFIDSGVCSSLNDDFPAIIFADACSNSETTELSIGASMMEQGGVGFVGSTRVAYGMPGWSGPQDGSSQSLDYFFSSGVMSGGLSQGAALQYGLYQVYQMNGWYYNALEICEWTLYGNPDLGMSFALSSDGTIMLDSQVYAPEDTALVTVRDLDLDENPGAPDTIQVELSTANGDLETLTLTETGNSTYVFENTIDLLPNTSPVPGNGLLEVQHGEEIQGLYIDEDDGHGGTNVDKTAVSTVDGVAPIITFVEVAEVSHNEVTIHWLTDEASDTRVTYGQGTPSITESTGTMSTDHLMVISGLDDCTGYVFYVESCDAAGNIGMDDNGGTYYGFLTWEQVMFFSDDMESGPGDWSGTGLWHMVDDSSSCSEYHSETHSWYYGQEPQCNYDVGTTTGTLTSGLIDLTGISEAEYHVWYWHQGEGLQGYDTLTIQIQIDGQGVDDLLEVYSSTSGWQEYILDMDSYVGNQIFLKFHFDSMDDWYNRYQGSYIDDVSIFFSQPCDQPTPTPTPPCIHHGDVTFDGEITSGDAQLAFQIGLGSYVPTYEEGCAADCNGDGENTVGDAQGVFIAALEGTECVDPI